MGPEKGSFLPLYSRIFRNRDPYATPARGWSSGDLDLFDRNKYRLANCVSQTGRLTTRRASLDVSIVANTKDNAQDKKASSQTTRGVPLLDLARQHGPLLSQFSESLNRVCQSGWFVLGPEVAKLEESVAKYSDAQYAVGCASGSDALLLAMMACGIGDGDEVILPSFTFFATASAVTRLGATPIFADIDPVSFNISPAAIESLITPKTKAIIPVHLFGRCAEMDQIVRIAKSASLAVIEDCAQAIGAEFQGRRAGSMGEIGCFSFYPTKNLGGAGDGGMLTSNSDALADSLQLLRGHGMRPRYYHKAIGINSRLDAFQAAILNIKMPLLDQWSHMRQTNAKRYTEMFEAIGLDEVIGVPDPGNDIRHVWNQYVIRVPNNRRNELRKHLTDVNIGTEIYYPLGLHRQECFQYLGQTDLPETDRAAAEVLALPIFPELTAEEQQQVVETIALFFANGKAGHCLPGPKFLKHPSQKHHSTSGGG